jgi:hypothetical protein
VDADKPQLCGLLPDFFWVGVVFQQLFDDILLEFALDEFLTQFRL